jgi:hypothetical protein
VGVPDGGHDVTTAPDGDAEPELLPEEEAAAYVAYVGTGAYLQMSWQAWIKSRSV